ncbi:MAG: helix-turn-helix transcriptional regulator, partial [Propioniciclava sp.]
TLGELAAAERVSARTVQRAFLKETGLSFSQWRARCRLSAGAERLREGASVTQAARACGYTPSTFIARYRAEFGITPGREAHQLRA